MAHTKSSKRIWQEVRAKVKAERMKEVYPYMYNTAGGHIGTMAEVKADRKRQLNGIYRREIKAERQIATGNYNRNYPQGFVELMYAGIVQVTPNTFLGPPIEPSFSHIDYPMSVFEGLQKDLNGREFISGYTDDTRDARFDGNNLDLTSTADYHVLRSLGVFSREILTYFPIEETLDALKEVKKRITEKSSKFGKTEKQGLSMLEKYLNHEVLLPIWVAENHRLSDTDFTRVKGTQCDLRDLRDCLYGENGRPSSSKSVKLVLEGGIYQIRRYSGKHTLSDITREAKTIVI